MTARVITLEAWLALTYGEDAPHINTARKWVRDGKIQPAPTKHGRSYFVDPEARYTDDRQKPRLAERLRAEATTG